MPRNQRDPEGQRCQNMEVRHGAEDLEKWSRRLRGRGNSIRRAAGCEGVGRDGGGGGRTRGAAREQNE